MRNCCWLSALAWTLVAGCSTVQTTTHIYYGDFGPQVDEMVCVLTPTAGNQAAGTVVFKQDQGFVKVIANVSGLTPGKHGFHVHHLGDTRAVDGMATGGHFDPKGHPHGGPGSARRHAGDLGNLEADATGTAHLEWDDYALQLNGPETILGRSIIVHAGEDDLMSQPTGNAGARVAQGVIGIAKLRAPEEPHAH
ncbi:MAG: superoxide dismutase family protein [Planctomycetota bacterium]